MYLHSTTPNSDRCRGCRATSCVPADLVDKLRSEGLHDPVTSLADPRLRQPESLLESGYYREDEAYVKSSGDATQTFRSDAEGWRLESRVDGQTHVVRRTPRGEVFQWLESDRLEKLDDRARALREPFEQFRQSGQLPGRHAQDLELQEVRDLHQRCHEMLLEAVQADETGRDLALEAPGEVRFANGVEARFIQTPCGLQFLQLEGSQLTMMHSDGVTLRVLESVPGLALTGYFIDTSDPSKSYRLS